MKHLKLFFALFAMLALGVGNAWGATATITFSNQSSGTSDGSSAYGTSNFVSSGIASSDAAFGTITCSATSKCYSGKTGMGLKAGGSSAAGSFTITFSTPLVNVSKVTLNAAAYRSDKSVDITVKNGSTQLSKITSVTNTTLYDIDIADLNIASFNTLTIESTKYCYIKSITITYNPSAGGETPDPTPEPEEPDPTPGTGSSTNWVETVIADITASDIVVITMSKDGTTYALTSANGSSAAPTAVVVTVNGDKLAAEPIDELKWNIATSGTEYIIYPNGINNKYLYCTNTNNGIRVGTGDAKVFTINSGYLYTNQTADARHIGVYNAQDWRCYKPSSGAIASNISGQTLKFYKYVAPSSGGGDEPEPEKTATSLVWSQTEYAVTMGETPTFPTLTTIPVDLTGVTYSSSNEAVATIAADGTITINAVGETTIKASYAGNEIYAAATDATYKLTVNKAPATETENVYVKVTSTEGITDGEYLIVYEDASNATPAPVAFNGALATLDAAKNTVAVAIDGSTIAGNTDIDAALFTIDVTAGTLKSASGKYIGVSSNSNGLKTEDVAKDYKNAFSVDNGNAVIAADFEGSTMSLRYNNTAGDNNLRFRYYKNAGQQPIALYKKVDPNAVVEPIFTLVAGEYYGTQSVTISCATAGAEVYYTLDGTDPTSESTKYTGAISIASTTTVKAIAVKGANSSAVVSATYTILAPLATMQAIFDKATEIGKDAAQSVKITFDEWVISAVVPGKDEKPSSNAYITDGDKGFIIYTNTGHGFKVGDKLSGTITCDLTLYNGSAEVKGLISTTTGLTVVENGTITPVELNATQIEELSGVNTGSVIKITGPCTVDGTKYYVAGVQLYNSLYTYTNPTVGNKYNVTGVYLQYNEIPEILPRSAADIEEIIDLPTATISIANITMEVDEEKTIEATVTPDAAKTTVVYSTTSECITISGNTITATAVGTATVTATIAEKIGEYYGATKDFTVTVTPKSTKDNVVVLAKYGDQWYAMMAQYVSGKTSHLAALPVSYVGGKLYNVADADKALIEWTRAVVDGKATFSNNSKYLTGKSDKTDLTLAATSCEWAIDGSSYLQGDRTFFYNAENNWFRNFKTSNAEETNYSALPVVTAPVYTTGTLYTIKATAENGTVVGAGVYVAGDKVTLTADPAMDYTFVNWTKGGEVVSTANPFVFEATEDLELVANFAEISQTSNTLSGTFSVGEYEVAQFATGNLQYNVKNKEWSFAKQQYQYIGDANINVGDPTFTGTIDMFGWSTNETTYGVDPRNLNELYDGEFVDWGNLFPVEDNWSTLSADQWKYLLNERTNASSLKQIARVGSVVGIMLFPDVWNAPLTVTAQPDSYFEVDIHNYTLDQWAALENAGALFLPAAGRRTGGYGNMINYDQQVETNPENLNGGHYKHQDNTNIYCYYWTSTINEDKNVSYLHNIQALGGDKYTINTGAVWGEKGRYGQSVRLAKVTKQYYTREVDSQYYGTICLAKAAKFEGGSLYEVSYFDESTKKVYFDEIENGVMEAGMPYVFLAEKNVICAYYTSDTEESAQDKDGLYGTLVDITSGMNADGVYMIYRNQIIHSTNPDSYLNANRAYIKLTDVPGYNNPLFVAPAPVPGRKRISMGTQATNTATGVDEVQGNNVQSTKVLMDGTLYIFRNGKMYDAQGKLVK